jgi:pSer/pThr/pTyr-binding forkhead associated (FHA) protein
MAGNQTPSQQNTQPQPNLPALPAVGKIFLQLNEAAAEGLEVDLSGTEGFVLGRSDSKSSYLPDIDLAVFKALDKGVSRRHAAFVRYENKLHIVDLSSVNGTFLNGSRLAPEVPYPVHPGDRLVLGELTLHLSQVEN